MLYLIKNVSLFVKFKELKQDMKFFYHQRVYTNTLSFLKNTKFLIAIINLNY
jgi:hypothetical protein